MNHIEYRLPTTIKDWPINTAVYHSQEPQHGTDFTNIFLRGKYVEGKLLSTLWKDKDTKYVVDGKLEDVFFVSMLLNSYVGNLIINRKRDANLTLRRLNGFPTPAATTVQISSGAVLESYIQLTAKIFDPVSIQQENEISQYRAPLDFLSLIRNYYIEELYIPDTFKKLNISIVDSWIEVLQEFPNPTDGERGIEWIKNLFDVIVSKGQNLLLSFNKMKLLHYDVIETLSTYLNL